MLQLRKHHHPFPNIFASNFLERKRGRLPRYTDGHGNAFPLDGADGGVGELAEGVGAHKNVITCVYRSYISRLDRVRYM